MKKGIVLSIVFFLVLILVAVFTKPTRATFLEEANHRVMAAAEKISQDPVMVDVVKMQQEYLSLALEKTIHSSDYFFFSTHQFELGDGEYRYLGVFGFFIPLQKDNPLDQFYQDHEKN